MENRKEEREFSNPKFYLEVFQGCLENENREIEYNTDWLTVISSYSQTMKTEIGSLLNEDTAEEVSAFIQFSLGLQERIERQDNCINIKNKDKVYNIPEQDIDLSKEYLRSMIFNLGNL